MTIKCAQKPACWFNLPHFDPVTDCN